ncbi:MAG TPA: alpha/beta hydrolase-fold protein [Bryobacteraceae bacterium]|nr:alpha/beta hydrolase-fold protein [Bryobacteraceae bacterium]
MKLTRVSFLSLVLASALPGMAQSNAAAKADAGKKGTFEKIKVHGKSLEGNLEGDSPDRDVFVYLPPSYATSKTWRYPVVYFLHGYGINAERYWNIMTVPDAADKDITTGAAHEMILVHPDAFTVYNGSMYSSSPTTGDWETFLTQELVSYIDSHYRTLANRDSRGLAGHSMGGYGTLRLSMKYPEVYSSIYAMSSCCLMNNPGAGRGPGATKQPPPEANNDKANSDKGQNDKGKKKGGAGFSNVTFAEAAAWSPNPANPPQFLDLPTKDGQVQPAVAAKWVANSPLAMVPQYVTNLKKLHAIAMDVGLQDGLLATNQEMDQSLAQLGVTHTFETYEGDHNSRVKERFETKVLPFFSNQLAVAAHAKSGHR